MKGEVDKLCINKLANVRTRLNNSQTKVDDLDVCKSKTLRHVVDNKVVKNTKLNTLKAKVNNLEKKISDATTSVHINQYNRDKQNVEKKLEMLIQK